jgi:hypothetical protein
MKTSIGTTASVTLDSMSMIYDLLRQFNSHGRGEAGAFHAGHTASHMRETHTGPHVSGIQESVDGWDALDKHIILVTETLDMKLAQASCIKNAKSGR